MKNRIAKISQYVRRTSKTYLFIYAYLFLVAVGFVLALLSYFFPILLTCLTLFHGDKVCSPVGFYIAALPSFPGYLGLSLLMVIPILQTLSPSLSLAIVGIVSLAFYYGVGKCIDKKIYKKLPVMSVSVWISLISFFTLLFILGYLVLILK
jgi:hypothetical protein